MELTVTSKPTKKIQQVIWLEPKFFAKIAEMSSELGVAPNVVISEIVKRYLEKVDQPIKVVEKPVPAGWYCPICISRFTSPSDLIMHLRYSNGCKEKLNG